MKKKQIARNVWVLVLAATTLLIWFQSLIPATGSYRESQFIKAILDFLLGEGVVATFLLRNIRKVAHFAEFCLLGGEWAAGRRRLGTHRFAVLYGLAVAAVDELLQFFAPGRAPMVTDVLLDYAGYLCGFLLVAGAFWLCRRLGKQRVASRRK